MSLKVQIKMDTQTVESYNRNAKAYDEEVAYFWDLFPDTFIKRFAQEVQGLVLDVGSGSGRDAGILREAGLHVVCLDASESMVQLTEKKGFESICADFAFIPFEDNAFDAVWCYTSLLHIPKEQVGMALKEVSRVLKPNGVLGLGLIEGNTEGRKEGDNMKPARYFAYYQKDEIEHLLKEAGFIRFYFEAFQPRTRNYLNFLARKFV